MNILFFIIIVLVLIILAYLYMLIEINEFNHPYLKIAEIKLKTKVLVIYPHPDDETMASGGLVNYLATNKKFEVKVVSTTKGQKGDELVKLPPVELGELRSKEFHKAMKALKVKDFEIWNMMDGEHKNEINNLKLKIKNLIIEYKPDLVVTYEKYGTYGHPDHIALSKVVHELSNVLKFKVLYSTLSNKIAKKVKLPTHMAEEEIFVTKPEFKFPAWRYAKAKYNAAKKYKTQTVSGDFILELVFAVNLFEYYTEKYDS